MNDAAAATRVAEPTDDELRPMSGEPGVQPRIARMTRQ